MGAHSADVIEAAAKGEGEPEQLAGFGGPKYPERSWQRSPRPSKAQAAEP
jgi:hypothetical protein